MYYYDYDKLDPVRVGDRVELYFSYFNGGSFSEKTVRGTVVQKNEKLYVKSDTSEYPFETYVEDSAMQLTKRSIT